MEFTPEVYQAIVALVDDRVREIRVQREDFDALRETVRELAEAMKALAQRVDQLTDGQRILTLRVDQLADGQRILTLRVDQLTQRVDQLAQHMDQLTLRVDALTGAIQDLRREVGVVSNRFGFTLEELAADRLPRWFKAKEGWLVEPPAPREFRTNGQTIEVDLIAEARKGKRRALLVGSVKSRIGAGDVRDFCNRIDAIPELAGAMTLPVVCGLLIDAAAFEEGRKRKVRVLYLRGMA